jgi:hypothetical protein
MGLLAIVVAIAGLGIAGGSAPVDALHDPIVASVRGDGDYYRAVADLVRSDPAIGESVPTPALPIIQARLPGWAAPVLLAALVTLALWVAAARLADMISGRAVRTAAVALLAAGMAAGSLLVETAPSAGWAAMLVALAVFVRRPGRWVEASAIGCCAALIDPSAVVALLVMGLLALSDGRGREPLGWAIAALVAAAALAAHRHALAGLTLPAATIDPGNAIAVASTIAFPLLPAPLAATLLVLAAIGWAALPQAIGVRVVLLVAACVALEGVAGLHPATLGIVLLPIGLAFAPAAVRDLWRVALDRRRITVTRISR